MFLWDFVADKVMGQIVDWIYSKLLEFLGEFFGMMGSMGADLFDYDFVRAIIELFRLFGWALFVSGMVVAVFEIAVEYQSGRGSIKDACANWNFILWGLYYCVLLILEKTLLLPYLKKGKVWPHIYTLLLVMVGWAFFVGSDVGVQLPLLLQRLFVPTGGVSALYFLRNYGLLLAVGIVCASPITLKVDKVLRRHKLLQGIFLAVLLVITIAYMVDATNSPFLYFRF